LVSSLLGSDKSRGYCLEMICADFLAGAHLGGWSPKVLLLSAAFPAFARGAEAGIPAA